jgi:hypothetical protein
MQAVGYGLEDRGIVVPLPVIGPDLGLTHSPSLCIPAAIFVGLRRSGRKYKHSSSFSAEVEKKEWSCSSSPAICIPLWRGQGQFYLHLFLKYGPCLIFVEYNLKFSRNCNL